MKILNVIIFLSEKNRHHPPRVTAAPRLCLLRCFGVSNFQADPLSPLMVPYVSTLHTPPTTTPSDDARVPLSISLSCCPTTVYNLYGRVCSLLTHTQRTMGRVDLRHD